MLLVFILLQVPAVQNFAKNKAVAFLENKIHTKVRISRLSLSFPKRLVLEGVYFEDQRKDTLLYGGKLQVDIALLKLINGKVEVNYVGLNDVYANIYRTGTDTVFNYQYIVDAFAGKPEAKPADTTSGGMQIKVDKIQLANIRAKFRDDQTGTDTYVRLGRFETRFKQFDLDHMTFNLPSIELEDVSGYMYQKKPLLTYEPPAVVEAESNEPMNLKLLLDKLSVKKIQFDYRNDVSPMRAKLNLGELSSKVKAIDLAKLDVQLDEVKLHNTTASIGLGKSPQTKVAKEEISKEAAAQANNPWKIRIANVDFENNNIAYEDDNTPRQKSGMDFAHLKIDSFTLKGNDVVLTPTAYAGNITQGSFREQSGFNLKQFTTQFAYSDTGAYLNNLYVETDRTIIRNRVAVRYPSIAAVTKNMGLLYLDANLSRTDIAAKDILLLAPQLQANLRGYENAVVHLNANIKGYINNLSIPTFQVSGIGNTAVSLSGNIKGLPDANKTSYNLNIDNFQTTKADLNKLLPPNTLPANVRLPDVLRVSGSFKGLATNFVTNLRLVTNKGTAAIAGFLNSNNETYDIKASLNNVDVGYLIKQDTMLGKVTLTVAAKGRGFQPATMTSHVKGNVQSAYIMGYNYRNLDLAADVNRGRAVLNTGIADPNVAFRLQGEALFDDKYATNIKMRLMLDSILMQPLHLTTNDLRLHGNIVADIPKADLNAPQGNISLDDLVVFSDGRRYKADSITIDAATTDTGKIISLNSQIAYAKLAGQYSLTTIGTSALQVINKYYNLGVKDTALSNDKWQLTATVIPDSLLFAFAPTLRGTDTIHLRAGFDGASEKLDMAVNAPRIQMGTQVIDSLTVTAGNDAEKLGFSATMNKAGSPAFMLEQTSITGFVANNEVNARLNIKDAASKNKYGLGLKLAQENTAFKIHLSDSLLLDYENWTVNNSNFIRYDSTGIIVRDFAISNNGQSLSIQSQQENVQAPIEVNLKDFHIKTLTNLAEQDSLQIDGTINGNVVVRDAMTNPVFTSDISVNNLTYAKDTVGNITVKVDNQEANTFNAAVAITGKGNDVQLKGKYYTGEGRMNMQLDVNNLNMSSIQPLTFGALTYADGSLKGNVAISGTTANPNIDGAVRFENANIIPAATGEKLHLSNEEIVVSTRDIIFDRFTLVDSAGNKAVIDGNIYTNNFQTFRFDMTLNAEDFQVLNAKKVPNALYYGRLNMDADVSVKGTLTAPKINADLKVNKNTDISFVIPNSNPEVVNRDGVVVFVDRDATKSDSVFLAAALDSLTRVPELAGLDISGTLQSDTAAQITLVIDERSGDALKIRGKSDLSGGIDPSGKISLTGTYELVSGAYNLSLSVLKRQFNIQPGSTLTWTGDPMSANVNITAAYIANTQPINLMQNELANTDPQESGKYKSKLPFSVLLKMNGELLKPQISFDITLPQDEQNRWQDVETKLESLRRDEGEMNKQVFALLLLNRFIQENPLENSAGGTSIATQAKQSVSNILADQLNNLANSLAQGVVDLNIGVSSTDDYTSGTAQSRTDLNVGVSKKLLNDRLRVSVGSNFEVEGNTNANESASNIAGDVAVDYLLSKDGRYALRAYRKNRYEGVVEGQVIETGVSFIFTLDFNNFSQIFYKKTAEQKEIERREKERQKLLEKKQKEQEKIEEVKAKEEKELQKAEKKDQKD